MNISNVAGSFSQKEQRVVIRSHHSLPSGYIFLCLDAPEGGISPPAPLIWEAYGVDISNTQLILRFVQVGILVNKKIFLCSL